MKVLVTGANDPLVRNIITFLNASHTIRAVDAQLDGMFPDGVEAYPCDLRTLSGLTTLVEGMDVILHFAPISLTMDDDWSNLEHATRGTYHLLKTARTVGVKRFILGSTQKFFASVPAHYHLTPNWRPRPRPAADELCAWLAENIAREDAREPGMSICCIRLGTWETDLAINPVIKAVSSGGDNGWEVIHVGPRPIQATPNDVIKPASRSIRNVVIFGAGGPMASIVTQELKDKYRLRLTDVRPLVDIAATAKPQSPGAPLPQMLGEPHEMRVVDVGNAKQVLAACEGMDAIINCSVIRKEVVGAFRVNTLGCYNIMQAAVAHGIRRVVQTGPFQLGREGAAGYNWDMQIVEDIPARPGGFWDLYFHSKLGGQEICRIFAEHHGLEIPNLLFCDFVDPIKTPAREILPFTVSWQDAARAIAAALTATMPSPYEIIHVNADLPHGVFPNEKAKRILGWQPRDDLRKFWSD